MADGYLKKEEIFNAAVEDAVRFSLDEIKTENDWVLIDQPKIEVTSAGPGLTYKATLTLFPDVDLTDYKKVAKVIFSKEVKVDITKEELKKTLDWVLNSRASETRVNRESKEGDLMEIDLDAFHESRPISNSSFKKEKFILGDSKFIPGFDKALAGKKENEEFNFKLEAPKDYWQKDYQGKELEFKGKVHSVFERAVPELNDEFAKSLGPSFSAEGRSASGGKTPVEKLMENMREGLIMEKKNKEVEKQSIEVLKKITKESKMDIPEVLIERTLDSLVQDMLKNMGPTAKEQNQDPEKFVKELREQLRERARENVASHLVIYKLAKAEGLEPTKEEISAQAAIYGLNPETDNGYLYDTIQTQKVFQFLKSQAKVEEKEKKEDN